MNAAARKMRSELARQSGVLGALIVLAEQVRESAVDLASAIEGVALEIDRERRGLLSIGARQDTVEISTTILSLLRDPLLDTASRDTLRSAVLQQLSGEAQAVSRSSGSRRARKKAPLA